MKRNCKISIALIVALLAFGILSPGCAQLQSIGNGIASLVTPATQPAVSQQQAAATLKEISAGYTLIERGLIAGEDSGLISLAEFKATLPYRHALSDAILHAQDAIIANDSTFVTLLDAAQAAYNDLKAHPVVKKSPTTQPAQ